MKNKLRKMYKSYYERDYPKIEKVVTVLRDGTVVTEVV